MLFRSGIAECDALQDAGKAQVVEVVGGKAVDQQAKHEMGEQCWSPGFVDYLFLAFNTSTAFSPTDVPVLSRWAKLLMMMQSSISLATIALLAARAVNIL